MPHRHPLGVSEPNATPFAGTGLSAGDVLLGKYRIERMLGRGGMGFVVLATHLGLDQKVAIKMLLPSSRAKPEVISRFEREARAAAKLRNEHVVRVMDVGVLEDGAPYIVMEHLVGHDLAEIISERGALPIAESADVLLQACEAIAEAHARGLVHRDLKPSNLFVVTRIDGTRVVKLLDFGITKEERKASGDALTLTGTETVIGSPRFMAPEQLKSARDADARSDIWSLGVILYQMLSGSFPFDATTATGLAAQIASEPPEPLRGARSDLPDTLVEVVDRCLQKDRALRYQAVLELARALAPFSISEPKDAPLARIEQATALGTWESLAATPPVDPSWSAANASRWSEASAPSAPPAPRVTIEMSPSAPSEATSRPVAAIVRAPSSIPRPAAPASARDGNLGRIVAALILSLAIAGGGAMWLVRSAAVPRAQDPEDEARARPPAPRKAPVRSSTAAASPEPRDRAPALAPPRPRPKRSSGLKARDPLDVRPY
jgi:eukaryotic-like serine/threonine-protein kinase